jgi:hypothetical protein
MRFSPTSSTILASSTACCSACSPSRPIRISPMPRRESPTKPPRWPLSIETSAPTPSRTAPRYRMSFANTRATSSTRHGRCNTAALSRPRPRSRSLHSNCCSSTFSRRTNRKSCCMKKLCGSQQFLRLSKVETLQRHLRHPGRVVVHDRARSLHQYRADLAVRPASSTAFDPRRAGVVLSCHRDPGDRPSTTRFAVSAAYRPKHSSWSTFS